MRYGLDDVTTLRPSLSVLLLAGLAAGLGAPPAVHAQEAEDGAEKELRVALGGLQGVQHGYLGVSIRDVGDDDVEALDLPEERGARVVRVMDDSPAAEAGLRKDDVIVAWGAEPVESVAELRRLVRETPPDRTVRVAYVRDGDREETAVEVGERRPGFGDRDFDVRVGPMHRLRLRGLSREEMEDLEEKIERGVEGHERAMERLRQRLGDVELEFEEDDGVFRFRRGSGRLGVGLRGLTDQLAEYFGVDGGALVARVVEGSAAEKAGLRAGDVIVSVGGEDVEDPGDVAEAVRSAGAGPVTVGVVRKGERRTVTVELPDREREVGMAPRPPAPRAPSAPDVPPAPPAPGAPSVPPVPAAPGGV